MTKFNDNFLRACRGEKTDHIPAWFMRQAGRYQPEYREIRKKYSLLDICKLPEVCAEVTILPITQLNADAAILFSDITLPLGPMGIPFDIVENVGPVIETPIREAKDIERIKNFKGEEKLPEVGETIKILRRELNVPLIGFIGAPFTLASYMIEGGPSKSFAKVKTFMYHQKEAWHLLMDKLVEILVPYMVYQVESGCMALQVFDSWVGQLSLEDYNEFVFPHMQKLFSGVKYLNVPLIHFGIISHHLLKRMHECGATVVGLDWRTSIKEGRKILGNNVTLQGNLDPTALLAPWPVLEKKVETILEQINTDAHVFNLGHGILPPTPGENLKRVVDKIHNWKRV